MRNKKRLTISFILLTIFFTNLISSSLYYALFKNFSPITYTVIFENKSKQNQELTEIKEEVCKSDESTNSYFVWKIDIKNNFFFKSSLLVKGINHKYLIVSLLKEKQFIFNDTLPKSFLIFLSEIRGPPIA
jgi:hypothetical protein